MKKISKDVLYTALIFVSIVIAIALIILPVNLLDFFVARYSVKYSNVALGVLYAYKKVIILLYIALGTSLVLLITSTTVYIFKAVIPGLVSKHLAIEILLIVLAIIFGLGFILYDTGVFNVYKPVCEDLAQYESGNFSYADRAIFEKTEKVRLTNTIEQNSKKTFTLLSAWQLEEPKDTFPHTSNKGYDRYLLPDDIEFDTSQGNPFNEYWDIQKNYDEDSIYRIGYTDNFHIINSIETIRP